MVRITWLPQEVVLDKAWEVVLDKAREVVLDKAREVALDKAREEMLDRALPAVVRITLVLVWPITNYGSLKEKWINLELDDQLPQVIPHPCTFLF